MKRNFAFRAMLWLLIAAILIPPLASCKSGRDHAAGTDTTGTVEPEEHLSEFFTSSAKDYVVIYPAGAKSAVVDAAKNLTSALNAVFGLTLRCRTDQAVAAADSPCEILVGETNRKESKTLSGALKNEGDWGIRRTGTRLALCGKGNAAIGRAVTRLLSDYVTGKTGAFLLPENMDLYWDFRERSRCAFELVQSYRIVYPDGDGADGRRLAAEVREGLFAMTGENMAVSSDKQGDTGAELLLGMTNRPESTAAARTLTDRRDYRIAVVGNKVVISGGCAEALRQAVYGLMDCLWKGELSSLTDGYLSEKRFYGETIRAPLAELDRFVPSWTQDFRPAEWLGSLKEKIYAVTTIDARNMSAVRNGDTKRYAAGSFEAIASAILCGVDLLAVDVFQTKDHVLVVAPEGNLASFSDAAERCASIGAASSLLVSDWTWSQISALKLTGSDFGRLLTLSEVVELCAGRCLLQPIVSGSDGWTDTLLYQAFVLAGAADSYYVPDPANVTLTEPKTVTALKEWYSRDASSEAVQQAYRYWKECVAKKPNHWSRLLWRVDGTEGAQKWQFLRDECKTFLYTGDIAAYCDYIGRNQTAATQTEDVNIRQPYTLSKDALGHRVMVISDIHYYTTANIRDDNLGITRAQKRELLTSQIRKELDGRGLDAILVLGDLATDNWTVGLDDAKNESERYTKNTYYAKALYDECFRQFEGELGIFVLAGNHDSFLNDKWREMFGTDRQYSFRIGNMAFIMLDTFGSAGSLKKSEGTDYVGINRTWLAGEMAKYRDCRVILCAHYFANMDELKALSTQYSNIIGFFHGHTHLYEAVDVGNGTMCINDGGFSYAAFASETGVWDFSFLDPRSAWGYSIVEWTADDSVCVSYRTAIAMNYQASNMTYTVAEERKTADIILYNKK